MEDSNTQLPADSHLVVHQNLILEASRTNQQISAIILPESDNIKSNILFYSYQGEENGRICGKYRMDLEPSQQTPLSKSFGLWPTETTSLLDPNVEPRIGCFRYFLASFVLLGISLSIHSRNVLSLAAVNMVADIQVHHELVEFLSYGVSNVSLHDRNQPSLDNSCPIDKTQKASKVNPRIESILAAYLPEHIGMMNASEVQLETAFKSSAKRRVSLGDLVDWTPSEQGMIFAAGSVGNLLLAIPLTRLGEIYGAKWIIFAASAGATIQAALMPLVSGQHLLVVILFQLVFNGLTYGADCAAYTLFVHWLAPNELAFFVSSLLICFQIGSITSSAVTATILTRNIHWSWCFYCPGKFEKQKDAIAELETVD